MGVDLSQVQGSGPNGRVLEHDVKDQAGKIQSKATATAAPSKEDKKVDTKKADKSASVSTPYVDEPVSSMREVIARRLLESKTTVPHYYLEGEIIMDKIIKYIIFLNRITLQDQRSP